MTEANSNGYAELTGIHARLIELGFGATLDEIGRMRTFHSANAIQRALDVAHESHGARQFLSNLIDRVRADVKASAAPPRQTKLFAVPTRPRPANWKPMPIARGLPYHERRPELVCSENRPTLRTTQQLRIEGKNACITFAAGDDARDSTVTVGAAPMGANGHYDWSNQITLAMTQAEILRVFAVTLDQLPRASGRGRDGIAGRWFRIEHKGKQLCLKVAKDATLCCVWLNVAEALRLSALMLAQARKGLPIGDNADIESLVGKVLAPMARAGGLY